MKKLTIRMMAFSLLLALSPQVKAAENPGSPMTTETTAPVASREAQVLLDRLYEIKAMDMSKMKSAEKKQLRKEVKSIKSELKAVSGGVYLSVGAIIIIILLLILLL